MLPKEHIPVLLDEVINLVPQRGLLVDGTVGAGGHARAMLAKKSLKVIGVDRDDTAPAKKLTKEYANFFFRHGSYADLESLLTEGEWSQISFVLLDLGFSSVQLADPERGIAFSQHGPLDMRYDQSDLSLRTAADIINTASQSELLKILREYGEETRAKKIIHYLGEERKKRSIKTTTELRDFLAELLPAPKRKGIHPATKTFQALRIAVNRELDELSYFLTHVVPKLPKDAVIVVISFHSLEDRLVKQAFKRFSAKNDGQGNSVDPILINQTKKPLLPTEAEIGRNPRARSAKMRVAVRI